MGSTKVLLMVLQFFISVPMYWCHYEVNLHFFQNSYNKGKIYCRIPWNIPIYFSFVVTVLEKSHDWETVSPLFIMFVIWRRIQSLASMSCQVWTFSRKSNHMAPFVELKEPPLFATLWIFYSSSSILAPSDRFNLAGICAERKSGVMKKIALVATTRTQKETSNTLNPRIIKLF